MMIYNDTRKELESSKEKRKEKRKEKKRNTIHTENKEKRASFSYLDKINEFTVLNVLSYSPNDPEHYL